MEKSNESGERSEGKAKPRERAKSKRILGILKEDPTPPRQFSDLKTVICGRSAPWTRAEIELFLFEVCISVEKEGYPSPGRSSASGEIFFSCCLKQPSPHCQRADY